jgi:hypothetical protein
MEPTTQRIRSLALIPVGLLLAISCGCNAVISSHPVGEKPARIVAKDWEGNWETTDGAVRVKVVDANKGLLKTFWIEDDKQGNPTMKTAEVELRESGDWLFASTREEGKKRGYLWGRIKNEDRQIIVWLPDENIFRQMVKDSVLAGKLDGDDVLLGELKPQHLKIVKSGEKGVLFDWDKPAVFVKMGN